MKRASVLVATLVVALSMAVALVGCSSGTYTPQTKDQAVSNSALKSSGTLRVGVNASNAPYAAESSGSIVGIDVDIAAAIADEMGLKLELVDVGSSVRYRNGRFEVELCVLDVRFVYELGSCPVLAYAERNGSHVFGRVFGCCPVLFHERLGGIRSLR